MLTVLSAGLPISAKDILTNAMNEVFDNAIVIQELTKENLRSRVRLSNRSVEVVLVVLDGVSSDMCKEIEAGLFQSDKYYPYVSDRDLVEFLNNKYGLSIVLDDCIEDVVSFAEDEGNENYLELIRIKDDMILNLECRIKELTYLYGLIDEQENSGVLSSELDELRDENSHLSTQVIELNSLCESRNMKIGELESTFISLKDDKASIEKRLKKVSKDYDGLVSELNELKVIYSNQSGVIRNKDLKIADLEKSQVKFSEIEEDRNSLRSLLEDAKSSVLEKETEIGNLKIDLLSKDRENTRYLRELESLRGLEGVSEKLSCANNTIDSLKSEISRISSDSDSLSRQIKENERVISQLSDSNDDLNSKLSALREENEELQERIKSDDESLFELNKEKLSLQSKLSAMEKSVESDNNTESLIRDIQDLQAKVSSMSSNVFTNIGMSALPNSVINAKVFNKKVNFENVRFAFAGSSESRKGAYKCLYDEFKSSDSGDRYLIVDLVSETSIDYVFQAKRVISGLEWFRTGGSVQQYLSSSGLRNTQILSLGLGYINDSYFLSIDWNKRLVELENSGYKVVVFCGDISNVIGRVLHESFASCGESIIYVIGNAVGSRSIVTNLRGLSNKGDSVVAYFEFNSALQRFYELVSKSNECRILSTKNKR